MTFNEFEYSVKQLYKVDCGPIKKQIILASGNNAPPWMDLKEDSNLIDFDFTGFINSFTLQAYLKVQL